MTSSDTSSSGYGSVDPLPAEAAAGAGGTLGRTASMSASTRTRLRTKKPEVTIRRRVGVTVAMLSIPCTFRERLGLWLLPLSSGAPDLTLNVYV